MSKNGTRRCYTLLHLSHNIFNSVDVEAEAGSHTNNDGRRLFKTPAYVI